MAVLGAAADPGRVGGRAIAYLKRYGYRGRIYPVNPRHPIIGGLPAYPSLAALPEVPELAVVSLPAALVLETVRECVAAAVGAVVIYTSGFAETGAAGLALEGELRRLAAGQTLICGPNCQGVANLFEGMVANFSSSFQSLMVEPGPVGFVTQSGLFGGIMVHECRARGLGLGYLVSTGNEAGVQFADVVGELVADPRIRVVGGYLEGVRDGERLRAAALAAHRYGKPLVVLKVGRSLEGSRAAASHTGSLTGSHQTYMAACRQWGIVDVDDTEELFDVVELFARSGRRTAGPRVGILTNSGGVGVYCADLVRELRLDLAEFSAHTEAAIRARLPEFGSAANPVDITLQGFTDADAVGSHVRNLLADGGVDAALLFFGAQLVNVEPLVDEVVAAYQSTSKPVVVVWMASHPEGLTRLQSSGVPVFPDPARGLRALAALVRFSRLLPGPADRDPSAVGAAARAARLVREAAARGERNMGQAAAKDLLQALGMRVPRRLHADDPVAAGAAADLISGRVALKLDSPEVLHKTEAGGVALGLEGAAEVSAAASAMLERVGRERPGVRRAGLIVEEMVEGGLELIVGLKRDPSFGLVVLAGIGGTAAEVLADTAVRVAPVSRAESAAMLDELRGAALLRGHRGGPVLDREAVVDVLVQLSELGLAAAELAELDVNPLLVLPAGEGVVALDALTVLDAAGSSGPPPIT